MSTTTLISQQYFLGVLQLFAIVIGLFFVFGFVIVLLKRAFY